MHVNPHMFPDCKCITRSVVFCTSSVKLFSIELQPAPNALFWYTTYEKTLARCGFSRPCVERLICFLSSAKAHVHFRRIVWSCFVTDRAPAHFCPSLEGTKGFWRDLRSRRNKTLFIRSDASEDLWRLSHVTATYSFCRQAAKGISCAHIVVGAVPTGLSYRCPPRKHANTPPAMRTHTSSKPKLVLASP